MPSPLISKTKTARFFTWGRKALDELCQRPDHLQRLAVVGAGIIMYPTLIGFALVVWLGYARMPEFQAQSLNFMGMALLASMALWGLVVVATLGIIKGFSLSGPGGVSVSLTTTADDPDVDPAAGTRVEVDVGHEGGHGRGRHG